MSETPVIHSISFKLREKLHRQHLLDIDNDLIITYIPKCFCTTFKRECPCRSRLRFCSRRFSAQDRLIWKQFTETAFSARIISTELHIIRVISNHAISNSVVCQKAIIDEHYSRPSEDLKAQVGFKTILKIMPTYHLNIVNMVSGDKC